MIATKPTMTPQQLADELGVGLDKVLSWIRSGQLRAFNLANDLATRPRWRIVPEDAEKFLAGRMQSPEIKPTRRRKQEQQGIEEWV